MTKITDAKADELRALCEKATPGPWSLYHAKLRRDFGSMITEVQCDERSPIVGWNGFDDSFRPKAQHKKNAAFIAAFDPPTALALLNERDELIRERDHFRKLDSEAATYVESVICMRTGFSGEPPYVGWKGLGLALNEALDERDAAIARAEKAEAALSNAITHAQVHKMEARGANASLAEAYQAATGATGEPGNWHGAQPIKDARNASLSREKVLCEALASLLKRDERNTCQHEETHRGGVLWEICDSCGAKWADDEGGKPQWVDPPEWVAARAALNASNKETGE